MAKQRLTENFSLSWGESLNIQKLPLQEDIDKKIIVEGTEKKVLAKWEIPVWRLGKKNLNGRTYKESLGKRVEKVYKETMTANLADHPDKDGSVKDILSVSGNPHVREGILWVDSVIVDEVFEKKLEKMVEAGYGLGVSSSVMGDVDSDGNVLDESVELDRWYDWVLSPSYEVYATKECKKESVEQKETIEEKITIDNIKESKSMSDEKRQKLYEKSMRDNLNKILEDADKKEVISEKILAFEEAATFVSDDFLPDMKKAIEEKIVTLKADSLVLAEKGKTVDSLNEKIELTESEKKALTEKITLLENDNKALTEKYETSCKLLDETKEYANNAVVLLESADAETGSKFSAREYLEIVESLEKTNTEKSAFKEKIAELEQKLTKVTNFKNQYKEKVAVLEKKISEMEVVLDAYQAEPEVIPEDEDTYNTDDFDYGNYSDAPIEDELDLDIGNDDEVEDYYNDLVDSDQRYEAVKKEILKCKTVLEAQRTALRLKNLVEGQEKRKIKESFSSKDGPDIKNLNHFRY